VRGGYPVRDKSAVEEVDPRIQDYSTFASEYDRYRYIGEINQLNEGFRRRALERLLPARADRSLDVACGTGRGVLILLQRSRLVVGVDGTLDMLSQARAKTPNRGAHYCRANAALLPFADGTFNLVSCLNFLHLFPNIAEKRAFTLEIARVLRPGGTALVEFNNALHGVFLGPFRKYFGKDIGWDWPWIVHSCFPANAFRDVLVVGVNIPFVWRVPWLRLLESMAVAFPFNYLANRLIVRGVRSPPPT
jgi:ubiquinone/menaquinone biosynthesis C-methylase UbiE